MSAHTATAQTLDTKVGDLVTVQMTEVRVIDGQIVETPITNTIRVESVDDFGPNIGCRGTVVATTCDVPSRYLGTQKASYIAKAAA